MTRRHLHATPTGVRRTSAIVFAVTGPMAFLILALWALPVWPAMQLHPMLVVMVYAFMLAVALGAGAVCVVAHMQVAVHRAFAAGVVTGQHMPAPGGHRPLRVVE